MDTIALLDGNSLLYRAFFALPPLTAPDGRPTGAVHGFLNMLFKIIDTAKPDYMAVAFDEHGPTFRHLQYKDYKAGRAETPDDLIPQFGYIKEILASMGIAAVTKQGYEADDFLGTLSKKAEDAGMHTVIVTGDKDALQLVGGNTEVWMTHKGISETEIFTEEHLMEKYGIRPDRVPDLKGLMGDSSDNIPGVKGVGEKTALNLLHTYDSIDDIYADIDSVKGKLRDKLIEGRDSAFFSRSLATIEREAPLGVELSDCKMGEIKNPKAAEVFQSYGLRSLMQRVADERPKEKTPVAVTEIADIEALRAACDTLSSAKEIAVLPGGGASVSVASDGVRRYSVQFNDTFLPTGVREEDFYNAIAPLLKNADVIAYNSSALRDRLALYGIEGIRLGFDICLAAYVLDATRKDYSFGALITDFLGEEPSGDEGAEYAFRLRDALREKLEPVRFLYDEIELPLADVLKDMERQGFCVDRETLEELDRDFTARLSALTEKIYSLAGHSFNILSTKQLAGVLFEELGLPPGKKTKTGYSTDSDELERLADRHPIVELLIEYRQLSKLKGTYIDGMRPLIGRDERIHSSFNQTVTATGRISSSDPNLQNIPVRMEEGKRIRAMFTASPGNILISADYSQIELRILAHISEDEGLIAAFRRGEDIHRRTAAEVWGVPFEDVTPSMRSAAKAVNFGIVYGISDFGLARNTGISQREARDFIDKYLGAYSGVHRYMLSVVEEGARRGYVETIFGRRRYLPELKSKNANMRHFGERVAMNAPIQGSAADIIKLAMVRVARGLDEGGYKAKLILQVHDELIIDCPEDEQDDVKTLLVREMEGAASLSIPLLVETGTGRRWIEAK